MEVNKQMEKFVVEKNIVELYQHLLDRWNHRDAYGMSALFADAGSLVGFDGTFINRRGPIEAYLSEVFAKQPTPAFVWKVREIRSFGNDTALLLGEAGMVPPEAKDIDPVLNTFQTLVAVREEKKWKIELFQISPATFHGRLEEAEKLSRELRELLKTSRP